MERPVLEKKLDALLLDLMALHAHAARLAPYGHRAEGRAGGLAEAIACVEGLLEEVREGGDDA